MKVLVTGGCGFLGSHLCEELARQGAKVVSYDNLTKYELSRTGFNVLAARNFNWDHLKGLGVELLKEDIRDFPTLTKVASSCDAILHTAAQPAMTISYENPRLDFETNTLGTFNVLEAARQHHLPVVNTSTIHVYGNSINDSLTDGKDCYLREPATIDEMMDSMTGLTMPLHASKMSAENYVRTYSDSMGVTAATFRLTGIYGERQFGGEDHGWVANFCIRAVLGKPLQVFGSGHQVRDILYVKDAVSAYQLFLKSPFKGVFNVGGGLKTRTSLLQCISLIGEILDKKPETVFSKERTGDMKYFVCELKKIQKKGFDPQVLPKQGLAKLLSWIETHRDLFVS